MEPLFHGRLNEILTVGPLYPVTLGDLHAVEGLGLGDFHRVV